MPFTIIRDDITHVKADAVVNAANEQLRRGGGVCGAIFAAAGKDKLQRACDKIGHCDTGSAVITPGFKLSARYVIHAVGPIWQGGNHGERELLASCYRSALELAAKHHCRSIAFPLISAGIYGYPHREALQVAQEQIRSFLDTHEMDVTLVLYDPSVMEIADDLRLRVERYIDDVYVGEHATARRRERWEQISMAAAAREHVADADAMDAVAAGPEAAPEIGAVVSAFCPVCGEPVEDSGAIFCKHCGHRLDAIETAAKFAEVEALANIPNPTHGAATASPTPPPPPMYSAQAAPAAAGGRPKQSRRRLSLPGRLRNLLDHLDAGFSETLLAMIDERGLKDSQVYKRANISRQHFSKMRSNAHYQPTKTTVLALAVALELSLEEASLLLERAGFAFNHADQRDVIVEFFIHEGIYDIFQINDTLFAYDQPLLG